MLLVLRTRSAQAPPVEIYRVNGIRNEINDDVLTSPRRQIEAARRPARRLFRHPPVRHTVDAHDELHAVLTECAVENPNAPSQTKGRVAWQPNQP